MRISHGYADADTLFNSEHTDFSESTEEIAPLTEEQKKAKLEELREKAAAKKAGKAMQEQEEAKRNEVRTPALLLLAS